MNSKSLHGIEVKNADKGEVTAVIATLNVIDKDGDVSTPETFEDGSEVLISAYQHTSWGGALPVGKGTIHVTSSEVILDGQFFMDTTAGRDTFQVVKRLGLKQEWSYGYDILDAEPIKFDGQDAQLLKRVKVHEASPVLVGAGQNTRTLSAKSAPSHIGGSGDLKKALEAMAARGELSNATKGGSVSEYKSAVRPHETPVTTKSWSTKAAEDSLDVQPSIMDLRSMYAWCDPTGDPEVKSSYRFPHHDGPNGAANLRACVAGIAKLNGAAGGAGIPDEDRRGVYNHLASHLADADRVPAELRSSTTAGPLKFTEEAAAFLAAGDSLLERATEVMALRRSKGKAIAADSSELLDWGHDLSKAFGILLDTPQEDAAREYARFVQALLESNPTTEGA